MFVDENFQEFYYLIFRLDLHVYKNLMQFSACSADHVEFVVALFRGIFFILVKYDVAFYKPHFLTILSVF